MCEYVWCVITDGDLGGKEGVQLGLGKVGVEGGDLTSHMLPVFEGVTINICNVTIGPTGSEY